MASRYASLVEELKSRYEEEKPKAQAKPKAVKEEIELTMVKRPERPESSIINERALATANSALEKAKVSLSNAKKELEIARALRDRKLIRAAEDRHDIAESNLAAAKRRFVDAKTIPAKISRNVSKGSKKK